MKTAIMNDMRTRQENAYTVAVFHSPVSRLAKTFLLCKLPMSTFDCVLHDLPTHSCGDGGAGFHCWTAVDFDLRDSRRGQFIDKDLELRLGCAVKRSPAMA